MPIRPRGVGEALETITIDELHRLLEMNKARKDGFVKCLTLNSYAADASPRTETKVRSFSLFFVRFIQIRDLLYYDMVEAGKAGICERLRSSAHSFD